MVTKMLAGRRDRWPVSSASFIGAKSNRLSGPDDREPSFESVLRTMHEAGYRGDVCCEVSGMVFSQKGYDPVAAAKTCYANLAPAFERAGIRRATSSAA